MIEKRFWLVSLEYDGEPRFVRDNNLIGEKSMSNQEVVDKLNELHEENKGIQDKIFKLLEWLETEKGIKRKEIKEWWND